MKKEDFAKFIFNRVDIDPKIVDIYYNDWTSSNYCIDQYKALLNTRS
jgi:hypothetical protein